MQYVMVTHFRDHWDKLPNNGTRYTKTMFRAGMDENRLSENTKTVFIKIDERTKKVEKAWRGSVYAFRIDPEKVYFKVTLDPKKPIPCPKKYIDYSEGWYFEEETGEGGDDQQALVRNLSPPFLQILQNTNDWKEFENYSNWLLKLVGIHELHAYQEQKGNPDGFFKFGSLAVIYDCTLEDDFQIRKKDQIENFCNRLKTGRVEINGKEFTVHACNKQVWIITRREARVIKNVDDITVREVPIATIIGFYEKRFEENLNEKELADLLARTD